MNNYNPTEMLAEEMIARMAAANREIEQLRAALAAVPVEALRQIFYAGRWKDQQEAFDKNYDAVDEWLARQGEVQS